MVDYSVATSSVPLGGRAVASIDTFDTSVAADVDSLRVRWYDHNGLLLEDLTRTTVDVTGTDIYGNATSITDPAGTGTYQATLVIDTTHYTPPATGLRFSLVVDITKGSKTGQQTFYFTVVASSLSVSLDPANIATGVMRQLGIIRPVMYVANSTSSLINLGSGAIYAINSAYKNGVAMTLATDYTWSTYRSNVQVTAAPAVNDHYYFEVQTRSDAFILDIVNRAIQEVVRGLLPHYDSSAGAFTASPSVVELIKSLAIGQLRKDLSEGKANDSAWYQAGKDLMKDARDQIRRIQRGEEGIYDSTGVEITRRTGSIVGGQRHTNGNFENRLGLQDRAQQHTGLFLVLAPDPIIAQSRSTRGLTTPGDTF